MKRFEMLWYDNEDCNGDYITKEFSTYQAMINYYEKNKHNKYNIMLTKRSLNTWDIIETYRY